MPETPILPTVRTVAALRAHVRVWRERGETVALVPTMGALHPGHLALVRMARQQADRVVASVFVNPTQFGPKEDFAAYPRDEVRDAELLSAERCDLMYAPEAAEMYPQGFATTVKVGGGLVEVLDGPARPGHFDGVATVVTKLLTQAMPNIAIFGEKDFQQLMVIRRLVRDLDLQVEILGAPIVRAADGLALSSRNAYLSEAERPKAGRLNAILAEAAKAVADGRPVAEAEAAAAEAVLAAGFDRIDYLEFRRPEDLSRLGPGPAEGPARVFVAAFIGRTRLIDNMAV
jgi:pantoate--beta-alanine ligase